LIILENKLDLSKNIFRIMKYFFLFFFFSYLLGGYAQEVKIVVMSSNQPVPYPKIESSDQRIIGDVNGVAEIRLKSKNVKDFKVYAIGYEESLVSISTLDTLVKVNLQPISLFTSDVVVTANRESESKRESIVRISTLNNVQLQSLGAQTLAEGISFQPGLRMENNCQNCGFSQLRMNGLGGGYNQFLMNGRPVFSSLNSIYGLEQIPVSWVERIEVIRGSGSVMYGANAIAGTVNIITKDPILSGVVGQVSIGYMDGSLDQYAGGSGAWVAKNNKSGVSVSVGQRYRDAYDRNDDGFTEIPLLKGLAVDVNSFFKPSTSSRIGVQLRVLDEFRRGGDQLDKLPEETLITEQINSRVYGGEVSYEAYFKNRNHKMEAFFATQHSTMDNYYGADMDPDGYGVTRDENYIGGLRHRWGKDSLRNQLKRITLVSGLEIIRNVLSDSKPGYNVSIFQPVNQFGAFSQLDWQILPKIKFNFGARLNYDNVVNKPILTPRVGFKYRFLPFSELRLNYANGYRIPQVFSEDVHMELVSGEVMLIRLGDNLKHETSHGFNADWSFDFKNNHSEFEFIINGFYTILNDVFTLNFTEDAFGQTTLEKRNGSAADVIGMSYDISWAWQEKLYVQAAFSWQKSRYSTPVEWNENEFSSIFLRTPDYYGSFLASYAVTKQFDVNSSFLFTGPMLIPHYAGYIAEDVLARTPVMFDWNIKLNYTFLLKRGVKLAVNIGVKNLLDTFQNDLDEGLYRDASYVYGPIRPRTYFVGVQIGNLF
jgi:outer membrane receptor for ferrienterochelin and colicins